MEEQVAPEVQVLQKPKRKWLKIGLVVVGGLVLLGAAAYTSFWYGERQAVRVPPKEEEKPPTFAPLAQPTPLTEDETADWKIYANTKHGYSIKYPSNWYLYEE